MRISTSKKGVVKGKSRSLKPKTPKKRYKFNRPEYTTSAYKNFVKQVKERDNCHCQFPGCKRHRFGIIVHHIIRWADPNGISLRYNPINGICLCSKCHDRVTGHEKLYAGLFFSIVQQNIRKQYKK